MSDRQKIKDSLLTILYNEVAGKGQIRMQRRINGQDEIIETEIAGPSDIHGDDILGAYVNNDSLKLIDVVMDLEGDANITVYDDNYPSMNFTVDETVDYFVDLVAK